MARAFLAFAGGLFEQTLERRALHVHVHRRPILLVNHGDNALEVDGIVKARRGLGEDISDVVQDFSIKNRNSLFGVSASAIHSFVQRIPAITFFW